MDSAVVASAAVEVSPAPLAACGILIGGPAGMQQQQRRAELVAHLKLRDSTVDALAHSPFHPGSSRILGEPFSAEDEPYLESLDAEVRLARSLGARTVLTGIGGDELMGEALHSQPGSKPRANAAAFLSRHAERVLQDLPPLEEAAAPASLLPEPSLLAAACRGPAMLRAGCWAGQPAVHAELLRFCDWLPATWHRRKRLLRCYLARRGLSADFLFPRCRENFAHVMSRAMIDHGAPLLRALLRESILVDHGYLDPIRLLRSTGRKPPQWRPAEWCATGPE